MRKLFLVFVGGLMIASCHNNGTSENSTTTDSSAAGTNTEKMNYPYTIAHPDDWWQKGSNANTMNALSSLKAFENGNVEESIKYFGDSVHLMMNGWDKTVSNDTLKVMLANLRKMFKSISIKMNDWQSNISKDKSKEWVSLWYRQNWEDMKGNKDSADLYNDFGMKDGKIIELDEYTRKLH